MKTRTQNRFPKGWDEKKVQRVIHYHENLSDAEAVREVQEAIPSRLMMIPLKLVPQVRRLVAGHVAKARQKPSWRDKKLTVRS